MIPWIYLMLIVMRQSASQDLDLNGKPVGLWIFYIRMCGLYKLSTWCGTRGSWDGWSKT